MNQTFIPNIEQATIIINNGNQDFQMKFVDFVNAVKLMLTTPTLQEVTDSGDTTTNSIHVDSITTVNGVAIGGNSLTDIKTLGNESIVQDSTLLFTINNVVYKVASTIQP